MASDLLMRLLAMNLAAAVAILVVLALRKFARTLVGVRAAYALWLIVPTVMFAGLLPPRTVFLAAPAPPAVPLLMTRTMAAVPTPVPRELTHIHTAPSAAALTTVMRPLPNLPQILVGVWLSGVAVSLILLAVGQRRALAQFGSLTSDAQDPSLARASNPQVGPALLGTVRPRVVVPADFEARFDPKEQAMILAHERTHLAGGHAAINALVALLKAVHWFNPLIHLGARSARIDQELACDAAVIERFPGERQAYAQALLKTQLAFASLPLGCDWPVRSRCRLEERIGMLAQAPSRLRLRVGACAVASLTACAGLAAWPSEPPVAKMAPAANHVPELPSVHDTASTPALTLRDPSPGAVAAAKSVPEAVKQAETSTHVEGPMLKQPEPAKLIVLAAIEPTLSPAPDVIHLVVDKPEVVADLSPTAPQLPVLDTVSTNTSTGDWGALALLSGKNYFGNGMVIQFHERSSNTYIIYTNIINGNNATNQTFSLSLVSKNTAIMKNDKTGDTIAHVVLLGSGWVAEWMPGKGVPPGFYWMSDASGRKITTFNLESGALIENQSSGKARIAFRQYAGSSAKSASGSPKAGFFGSAEVLADAHSESSANN